MHLFTKKTSRHCTGGVSRFRQNSLDRCIRNSVRLNEAFLFVLLPVVLRFLAHHATALRVQNENRHGRERKDAVDCHQLFVRNVRSYPLFLPNEVTRSLLHCCLVVGILALFFVCVFFCSCVFPPPNLMNVALLQKYFGCSCSTGYARYITDKFG